MENELKPCPFCGNTPDINNPYTFQTNQGDKWGFVVCCCHGPEVRTEYNTSENAPWHAEAIAAWNARAVSSPEFATSNPFNDIYHEAVNLMCFTHPDHADDARKCFDSLVANWNALRMSLFTEDSNG